MAENRPPGEKKTFQKLPGPRSVKRNLFGRDPDKPHDDLAKEVEELTKNSEKRFLERWNYDLARDQPVEGKVGWGPGIPLNTQTSLLHVPSVSEAAIVSTASESASSHPTNGSHDSASAHQSDPDSCNEKKPNGNSYQPPIKRQRSSDVGEFQFVAFDILFHQPAVVKNQIFIITSRSISAT